MKNTLVLFYCLLPVFLPAVAQTSVSEGDNNEIRRQAVELIQEYEDLLNFISDSHQTNSDIEVAIANRLDEKLQQRLFISSDAIIEDDLSGNETNIKEVSIKKYLRDFDLFYEKGSPPNVNFKDIRVDEAKKNKYVYVQVYFETVFLNSDTRSKKVIGNSKRIATIRADKIDGRWVTCISSIVFGQPVGTPLGELPQQVVNITRGKTEIVKSGGPVNALYSVAMPGLGNYYVGKKRPYWIIGVVGYGLMGYGIASHVLSKKQYNQYSEASSQSEINDYYAKANRNHLVSNYLITVGATLWVSDIVTVFTKGLKNKRKNK